MSAESHMRRSCFKNAQRLDWISKRTRSITIGFVVSAAPQQYDNATKGAGSASSLCRRLQAMVESSDPGCKVSTRISCFVVSKARYFNFGFACASRTRGVDPPVVLGALIDLERRLDASPLSWSRDAALRFCPLDDEANGISDTSNVFRSDYCFVGPT
jgi:hypothetical protein